MKQFNLEYQYSLFLERMQLSEAKMHPIQKTQLKETFFGAWGQLLFLLRDEISQLENEAAVDQVQGMLNQVGNFFLSIQNKQN